MDNENKKENGISTERLLAKLRNNPEFLSDPLEYMVKVLDLVHYGDEKVKKACLLSIVTAWLPNKYHVSCAITGPTMTGKTNLLHALFDLTPRSRIFDGVILLGMSPMTLFYGAAIKGKKIEKGDVKRYVFDVGHFVVFLAELPLLYLEWKRKYASRMLFRYLFSTEDEDIICHGTKTQYCIKGRLVFVTTLLDEDIRLLRGQELGRLLMAWVGVNWTLEDEKKVFDFILNMDEEREKQFEHGARLVRSFLRLLPNVKSVKLSRDAIKSLEESIASLSNKGDTEVIALRLASLSASYELLKYTANLIREGKEIPEKLDKLEVTGESVRYVWDTAKDIIDTHPNL
jgi:hypothetical protein